MILDSARNLECLLGRQPLIAGLESHAQHAVQHQCEEADEGVGTDALGLAVIDGGDLDFALEYTESALDVGQRLAARNDLDRGVVGHIRHQQQLAVHHACMCERALVDILGEFGRRQINADDVGHPSSTLFGKCLQYRRGLPVRADFQDQIVRCAENSRPRRPRY